MVAIPVRRPEERPFAELGEVGGQCRMEVRTAEHLDPGPLGEEPAETPSLVGIGDARQVKSTLLVKQPLARLHMPLDPIDDPEQAGRGPAREERLAGKDPDADRIHEGTPVVAGQDDRPCDDDERGEKEPGMQPQGTHRGRRDPELDSQFRRGCTGGQRQAREERIGVPSGLEEVERLRAASQVAPEEARNTETRQRPAANPIAAAEDEQAGEAEGQDQALDGRLGGDDLDQVVPRRSPASG